MPAVAAELERTDGLHGADQQAGEAPTGSMRHRTRRPQVGHSDSFTLAAAVVVLHIRCAASVVWTACGFWAQKQASTHAVSMNACAIDITGICVHPGSEEIVFTRCKAAVFSLGRLAHFYAVASGLAVKIPC